MKRCYYLILCCFLTVPSWAISKVSLYDSLEYCVVSSEYIEILEDTSGQWTIDDLQTPSVASRFYSVNRNYALNEHLSSVYWVRFKLKNLSGPHKKWLLEIMDSRQSEIRLYQPDLGGSSYEETSAGIDHGFDNREYQYKNFIFEIHPPAQEEHYYYLRITSKARTSFLIKITSSKYVTEYGITEYYLLGLYYGILLMMAIYSLFVFFMIRERVYLLYLLYIISWMYNSMLADGTGYQYVWPGLPVLSQLGSYISRPLLITVFVFYSLEFLKDKKNTLINVRYLYTALAAYLIVYPVQFVYDWSWLHNTLFLLPFVLIFYYSIQSLRKGYQPARYFVLSNSVLVLSIGVTLLKYSGLLDFLSSLTLLDIIIVYSTNIAMVIMIIILSFAMADRIRYFKTGKEKTQQLLINQLEENQLLSQKVNRELEQKVKERTREIEEKNTLLQEANQQLQVQAAQINEMNARLDLDNWNLKKSILEEKESRIKFKEISFEEFKQVYPNESICFQLLEEMKWEKGFLCKRCGNDKYGKGNNPFSRRCTKCRYDESVTADTIFHKCKFDINKALYILVMINRYGEQQSISDLAAELNLRMATCWNFAQKTLKVRNTKEYAKLDEEQKFRYLILQSPNL
jgi:hypothetical protein